MQLRSIGSIFWHFGIYYDKPNNMKQLNFRPRIVSYKKGASCKENEICFLYRGGVLIRGNLL